jgi:hypothetical protein
VKQPTGLTIAVTEESQAQLVLVFQSRVDPARGIHSLYSKKSQIATFIYCEASTIANLNTSFSSRYSIIKGSYFYYLSCHN